jgi:type I restriction enzyme M protein
MNMILHGIEAPNIVHANTLAENIATSRTRTATTWSWPTRPSAARSARRCSRTSRSRPARRPSCSCSTSSRALKAGGRAAIVIKNTFLSNTDNASVSLRKLLLESCNLHTVLDCPGGTFQGAGVKTVVLFFEKGAPTRKVWYYQLDPGRNMGKTNPLNDDDLAEFVALQKTLPTRPRAGRWTWRHRHRTYDLSVKNPNGGEVVALRTPQDILDEIGAGC